MGMFPLRTGEAETVVVGLEIEFIAAPVQAVSVGGLVRQQHKVTAARRE